MSSRTTIGIMIMIVASLLAAPVLAGTPPPAPAVPEPSSVLLFAVGGLVAVAALRLRRRK